MEEEEEEDKPSNSYFNFTTESNGFENNLIFSSPGNT